MAVHVGSQGRGSWAGAWCDVESAQRVPLPVGGTSLDTTGTPALPVGGPTMHAVQCATCDAQTIVPATGRPPLAVPANWCGQQAAAFGLLVHG